MEGSVVLCSTVEKKNVSFSMFPVWICADFRAESGMYLRKWTFLGGFSHSRGVRG